MVCIEMIRNKDGVFEIFNGHQETSSSISSDTVLDLGQRRLKASIAVK